MKALVKFAPGPGNMEIRDVPVPVPMPGQVLIEVREAGICGSDLHIYHSDIAIPLRPPVVTGHEFSGVIAGLGQGVTGYSVGDRVVSETAFEYCGTCSYCIDGFYNLCNSRRTLGYWFDGVFARFTVVPAARLLKIPDSVSFTAAAMMEPLACVVHAAEDCGRICPGDRVLVSGPGSIGLMALQVALAAGARVLVSGTAIDADRLKMALQLGAERIVCVPGESLEEAVAEFTGGAGVDAVLECSGAARAIDAALPLVKKRGYFTQIGLPGRKIEFDIEKVCYRELHFSGSLGSRRASWVRGLELVSSGAVKLEPLVTSKRPITEWQAAFESFEKKEGIKLFLMPVD